MNLESIYDFEWDPTKERANIRKHGVDFSTATLVFNDRYLAIKYDAEHSLDEDRFLAIGTINGCITVFTVVFTMRSELARIISARPANQSERKEYYDGIR